MASPVLMRAAGVANSQPLPACLGQQHAPQRLRLVAQATQARHGSGLGGAFGPQAIGVAIETITFAGTVSVVDEGEDPPPVLGWIMQGDQGPDLRVEP